MDFWASFWDIIWWFFVVFAFMAYLWAVLAIIIDLFHDHKLSGWWKALWFVFLIFVPFLTAVVYLIARGDGMAERSQKASRTRLESYEPYNRDVAGYSSSDEIAKAKILLDCGTISQAEFASIKLKALAK
ncbi:PLDc N-terminal domain-containing protein [Paeniglutamicibacter kerguelensis]|uniref:Signal transduction histidine kinase n=1 Tax=Paeniglutamicibacter kerguelensis TaxID=254788 RepID=A0ABS4X9Q7_9MICC|nr:PLDc N-terminal domain-containing protein [Paeniglutamicibacter kerguelensis]MBP2385192.1 signal transduction histidine kinase [Paeniglutamicibacter kerguelensis]